VAAHVLEPAQLAAVASHDQDRQRTTPELVVVARRVDMIGAARDQPYPRPESLDLELREARRGVALFRDPERRVARVERTARALVFDRVDASRLQDLGQR
jgi:hypothetical protein